MTRGWPVVRSLLVHTVAVGIVLTGVLSPGLICPTTVCGLAAANGLQRGALNGLHVGVAPSCCRSGSSGSFCCESACHCSRSPVPQPLPQDDKSSTQAKPVGIPAVEWNTGLGLPVDKPAHGRAARLTCGLCAHPSLQTLHVRLQP
jgi:hypothetical protein